MDRLTREEVAGAVARGYCTTANMYKELDADLITGITNEVMALLQSLSREAVRDEAFSVHHDFDLERITLAMVQAVDDEYACNEKLRIAYAHDAEYRRRTIAAVHQRLLNGWIDLVIKPLLAKYRRHFQSMQRIVEREALKREPNAAGAVYWLIERGLPAEWWLGAGSWVEGRWHSTQDQAWTLDASEAMRFKTKDSARAEADKIWGLPMVGTPSLRITEHMFKCGISS